MKKTDELRKEYRRENLGAGVRGKYFREYTKGTNLVLLQPAVAQAFPTSEAVNDALLSLLEVANRTANLTTRARKARRRKAAVRR